MLKRAWKDARNAWVQAPNTAPVGDPSASRASSHASFDDDDATVQAMLARIVSSPAKAAQASRELSFRAGSSRLTDRRAGLNLQPR